MAHDENIDLLARLVKSFGVDLLRSKIWQLLNGGEFLHVRVLRCLWRIINTVLASSLLSAFLRLNGDLATLTPCFNQLACLRQGVALHLDDTTAERQCKLLSLVLLTLILVRGCSSSEWLFFDQCFKFLDFATYFSLSRLLVEALKHGFELVYVDTRLFTHDILALRLLALRCILISLLRHLYFFRLVTY